MLTLINNECNINEANSVKNINNHCTVLKNHNHNSIQY